MLYAGGDCEDLSLRELQSVLLRDGIAENAGLSTRRQEERMMPTDPPGGAGGNPLEPPPWVAPDSRASLVLLDHEMQLDVSVALISQRLHERRAAELARAAPAAANAAGEGQPAVGARGAQGGGGGEGNGGGGGGGSARGGGGSGRSPGTDESGATRAGKKASARGSKVTKSDSASAPAATAASGTATRGGSSRGGSAAANPAAADRVDSGAGSGSAGVNGSRGRGAGNDIRGDGDDTSSGGGDHGGGHGGGRGGGEGDGGEGAGGKGQGSAVGGGEGRGGVHDGGAPNYAAGGAQPSMSTSTDEMAADAIAPPEGLPEGWLYEFVSGRARFVAPDGVTVVRTLENAKAWHSRQIKLAAQFGSTFASASKRMRCDNAEATEVTAHAAERATHPLGSVAPSTLPVPANALSAGAAPVTFAAPAAPAAGCSAGASVPTGGSAPDGGRPAPLVSTIPESGLSIADVEAAFTADSDSPTHKKKSRRRVPRELRNLALPCVLPAVTPTPPTRHCPVPPRTGHRTPDTGPGPLTICATIELSFSHTQYRSNSDARHSRTCTGACAGIATGT